MRKLVIFLIVVVAALGVVAWSSAAAAKVGRSSAPLATIGNSTVSGNYSVLFTFRDAQHQQDGAGAGTFTFDGVGHISGLISEQSRCLDISPTTPCGNATNIQAQVVPPSNYTVKSTGYASLDICLHLTYVVGPQGGSPGNADQYVEVMWEGAFSQFFFHGRFIQTIYRPVPDNLKSCDPSVAWVQSPNVTVGDLERV
jgi:hypothetical protein